ncbi:MAG: hypothetical protein KDC75_27315, partial [Phaeodactylibacter sp.]|nr:hypothetical protein [Phaeodactylibacter sp.]
MGLQDLLGLIYLEYNSGKDIIDRIVAAHKCTGKLITEIHIVGHASPGGFAGAGDYHSSFGLY